MSHAKSKEKKDKLQTVLKRHAAVFSKKLGKMKRVKAELPLRPTVPKFCPPRNVPYAQNLLNPQICVDKYPIPHTEDLFASLGQLLQLDQLLPTDTWTTCSSVVLRMHLKWMRS